MCSSASSATKLKGMSDLDIRFNYLEKGDIGIILSVAAGRSRTSVQYRRS